jgi:hypothetical protein
MDINSNDDITVEVDTWLDDVGDFLAGIGESIEDFITPDVTVEIAEDPSAVDATADDSAGGDLPNDGFYQSLPGMDSITGDVLDNTYQLIDDIDEFGVDTFGQEAWDETMVAVHNDPYGMLEGIETPAEMELRFTQEDAAAEERFGEWQAQQETEGAMAHGDDVIHDSEQLAWDTDWLLNRGW